jgi:hypothetical protein
VLLTEAGFNISAISFAQGRSSITKRFYKIPEYEPKTQLAGSKQGKYNFEDVKLEED